MAKLLEARAPVRGAASLAAIIVALSASAAYAQAGQSTDAAASPESAAAPSQTVSTDPAQQGLADIVVTAERRSSSLQRTPLSVTAVSGEALRASAKNSIASAISDVPAVQIQGNAAGAQVYIRGIGSNADSQLGDPAVNLNVDGIYQQETQVPTSLIFDVDRVEVLRGPQGTLYGRNATAGAINIVTVDPTFGDTNGYATAQLGNYGEYHSEAAANIQLGDNLALRAAAATETHDGYLSNGNNDANMIAGRLKLLYKPTDRLRVLVAGDLLRSEGNNIGSVEAPLSSHDAYDSDKARGYQNFEAWNVRTQIDYDTDVATFTVLAGHNDFNDDEANIILAPSGVSVHREGRQNSVELRASSAASSAIKWVGGLYYLDDIEVRQVVDSPVDVAAAGPSNPELRDGTARSYAAFANVTVPLTEGLRLTGGIRYTHDKKGARFVYTDGSDTPDAHASHSWESVTYKGQIEADVGPHSLLYGQVSSGFKAGGYAQQYPSAYYNPEKLTAFEAGSKNRFLNNHLQVNASAFYYKYRDYQAQYPDLVDGAFALVTTNAATARLYGAEIETKLSISPHDTLGISGSWIHARFGNFVYTSILGGTVDHTGESLPNSPSLSADISYDHDFVLGNGGKITAHANTHLSEGYWTTVERSLDSYQSSYSRTDAFLRYEPEDLQWDVRVFVRNLENKAIRTLGAANPSDNVLLLAPPRTYGVAATVRF